MQDPDEQSTVETPLLHHRGAAEPPRRPWRRREYQIAAAIGVTAVLGAGALAAHHYTQRSAVETLPDGRTGAVTSGSARPAASPGGPSSSVASSTSAAGATTGPATPSPAAKAPASRRPAPTAAVAVAVSTSGSLPKDRHYIRVYSARGDATGQGALGWIADDGRQVGKAKCTQTFKIGNTAARERPTMLLCWRTSAAKSVYIIAVDLDKRPSDQDAVATLNRTWSKMG